VAVDRTDGRRARRLVQLGRHRQRRRAKSDPHPRKRIEDVFPSHRVAAVAIGNGQHEIPRRIDSRDDEGVFGAGTAGMMPPRATD
jgi:hypothetical protein